MIEAEACNYCDAIITKPFDVLFDDLFEKKSSEHEKASYFFPFLVLPISCPWIVLYNLPADCNGSELSRGRLNPVLTNVNSADNVIMRKLEYEMRR